MKNFHVLARGVCPGKRRWILNRIVLLFSKANEA